MLKDTFTLLLSKFTTDEDLRAELWTEVEDNYSNKRRHYHTLTHLGNLMKQLNDVKAFLHSWDTILFTLYYHDIIYNPLKSDNEEKSAMLAEQRMKALLAPDEIIEHCKLQILVTKTHLKSTDNDINYFLDADLSVLGQEWKIYSQYYKNVRKEYAIYPDLVYNHGRKTVLHHFLTMERIFKTDFFYEKYELKAMQNLQQEIALL